MFAIRDNLELFWINTALQTLDEVEDVLRGTEWILSWGFLSTTPTRIPERVDVRGEKVNTSATSIVESASLCTDDGGHLFDELVVESRRHDDRLRERSRRAEIARGSKEGTRTSCHAVLKIMKITKKGRKKHSKRLTSASDHHW